MIIFGWDGFPQYAARCVGAFVKTTTERVVVIATRPRVPVEGMEALCGCEVIWVEPEQAFDVGERLGEVPRILIANGWSIPLFNRLRDCVWANGGKVFCSCDNNFIWSFREIFKAVRFRLFIRGRYDGFFVPGKSGVRLLRFYGVPQEKIFTGMYAADDSLFGSSVPICERPKRIIYVGQFCERKNVRTLVNAFLSLAPQHPDWQLDLFGTGPLVAELNRTIEQSNNRTILVHPFCQPEELARHYAASRVFILPSREEHWGLVVHEAALSGCVLLTSRQVGAAEDFVSEENGRLFDAASEKELKAALKWAMSLTDAELRWAAEVSCASSRNASISSFVSSVSRMTMSR